MEPPGVYVPLVGNHSLQRIKTGTQAQELDAKHHNSLHFENLDYAMAFLILLVI